MSAGSYFDLLRALGQNESGNNYAFVSSVGYLGRFQFGEEALKAIGFYEGNDGTGAIDFIGRWTAKAASYGVHDKASFLASPAAQDAAQQEWFLNIHNDLKSLDLVKYAGQWVDGGQVTMSGLIAGAHLVGVWNLKDYLTSNGAMNMRDPYGTPVSDYVKKFAGYDTPFSAAGADDATGGSGSAVATMVENILRVDAGGAWSAGLAGDLSGKLDAGLISRDQALSAVLEAAESTTSVATLTYQFFVGRTPSSDGIDYLVSPDGGNASSLNSGYYQGFGLENRYINFAVNLGKHGEGAGRFAAEYGHLTMAEATRTAYEEIFGAAPSPEKIDQLVNAPVWVDGAQMTRAQYLAGYGQDGPSGAGTKAAMVGWLLAEAEKADVGVYAHANAAFLSNIADGGHGSVDLVATYARSDWIFGG